MKCFLKRIISGLAGLVILLLPAVSFCDIWIADTDDYKEFAEYNAVDIFNSGSAKLAAFTFNVYMHYSQENNLFAFDYTDRIPAIVAFIEDENWLYFFLRNKTDQMYYMATIDFTNSSLYIDDEPFADGDYLEEALPKAGYATILITSKEIDSFLTYVKMKTGISFREEIDAINRRILNH